MKVERVMDSRLIGKSYGLEVMGLGNNAKVDSRIDIQIWNT
jgi:hypothetical protein